MSNRRLNIKTILLTAAFYIKPAAFYPLMLKIPSRFSSVLVINLQLLSELEVENSAAAIRRLF